MHIFLRDYAGVRWLWPNSLGLGTEIPKQATLSFPADLDRSFVSGLERGEFNVSLLVLAKLARVLGVKLGSLVSED